MSTKPITRGPLFSLGKITATTRALSTAVYYGVDLQTLLHRHVTGDWSEMSADDRKENEFSVDKELRIFSSYGAGDQKLWVITEADRSVTTILCPEDY